MFDENNNCPIYVPAGSVAAYKSAQGWRYYAARIQAIPSSPSSVPVPEAVDLGLSVKWASFNLGASAPEGFGDYYAWGETEPYYSCLDPLTWKEGKEGYVWNSYILCMGAYKTMTKYCSYSSYGYNGFTDNKTVLNPEDDAAHIHLGGKWRMPTAAEITELRDCCAWEWTSINDSYCMKVTGPNGNCIFLPAAGYFQGKTWYSVNHQYWSSSLYKDNTGDSCEACHLRFKSGSVGPSTCFRFIGCSIRPVYAE